MVVHAAMLCSVSSISDAFAEMTRYNLGKWRHTWWQLMHRRWHLPYFCINWCAQVNRHGQASRYDSILRIHTVKCTVRRCILTHLVPCNQTLGLKLQQQALAQAGVGNDVLSRIAAIQAAVGEGASCLLMATPPSIYTRTTSQVMKAGADCNLRDVLDTIL